MQQEKEIVPLDRLGHWPEDTWLKRRMREKQLEELGLKGKLVIINNKKEKDNVRR